MISLESRVTPTAPVISSLSGVNIANHWIVTGQLTAGDPVATTVAIAASARFTRKRAFTRTTWTRFALSTSDAMLEMCQTLLREHQDLRVQTHVNENTDEIRMVAEQFPWAADYVSVYDRFGLTGPRAVFAHNVHTTDGELQLLARAGTAVAQASWQEPDLDEIWQDTTILDVYAE